MLSQWFRHDADRAVGSLIVGKAADILEVHNASIFRVDVTVKP
jgi:hypothetical protein